MMKDVNVQVSVPSTTDQIILIPFPGVIKNNCKWCRRCSLQNFIEEKWLTSISKLITSWALLSALPLEVSTSGVFAIATKTEK